MKLFFFEHQLRYDMSPVVEIVDFDFKATITE